MFLSYPCLKCGDFALDQIGRILVCFALQLLMIEFLHVFVFISFNCFITDVISDYHGFLQTVPPAKKGNEFDGIDLGVARLEWCLELVLRVIFVYRRSAVRGVSELGFASDSVAEEAEISVVTTAEMSCERAIHDRINAAVKHD